MLCKLLKIFCELAKQSGKNMLRIVFLNKAASSDFISYGLQMKHVTQINNI